jgi:hypothetical protein
MHGPYNIKNSGSSKNSAFFVFGEIQEGDLKHVTFGQVN